jgi:hypothetical protein
MKTFFSILFFISTLFLLTFQSSAQNFDFSKYQTRTLAELVAIDTESGFKEVEKNSGEKSKGFSIFHGKPFYSAIRVTYIGTSKALVKEEKDFLKMWQSTFGYPAEILELFDNKYLFKECDKEYWIPVQKQVAAFFAKELKSGDIITIYLIFPGSLKSKPTDNWNSLFLVNEFEKY